MELNQLTAISPVDGRYRKVSLKLADYFSEYALIKYRVQVEIEYFVALCKTGIKQLDGVNPDSIEKIRDIYKHFSTEDALAIKEIEKTTNHDVKAVEYFLKQQFEKIGLKEQIEFIHFGLTSQDINNTAIPLSLKDATSVVIIPAIDKIIEQLSQFANQWQQVSMLAKTHGQPASPTKLGKEIGVFVERLKVQLAQLKQIPFSAKFGGATGNFNAHHVAFPKYNWVQFANQFVNEELKLNRSQLTTQIEHYDNLAAYFDALKRINTILIDFCRDIWMYISMEYFKQKLKEGEIGSSAMPHKVNPIDFENAEGNLGIAIAIQEHLSAKLPISRLQRDLTDSTVLRNIGVPLAHSLIAYESIIKGCNKLILNEVALQHDLDKNWAVVAEAIQTVLRRENYPKPYEALKSLTRTNKPIEEQDIKLFIDELQVSDEIKNELRLITPHNFTGVNFNI
jgi:adenylosuccinate lyase